MKNYIVSTVSFLAFSGLGFLGQAQSAFHKFSLSVSATEGSNQAIYSTKGRGGSDLPMTGHCAHVDGLVDPLIVEFGVSDRFGIGFTAGYDSYKIDANKFYNYTPVNVKGKMVSTADYFTFDFNYHPFVSEKTDLSFFVGLGSLKVNVTDKAEQNDSEKNTNSGGTAGADDRVHKTYTASGGMLRSGVKLRYYFWKRIGVMAMVTTFTGSAACKNTSDQSFGNNYTTSVKGLSTEFGLCVRFF